MAGDKNGKRNLTPDQALKLARQKQRDALARSGASIKDFRSQVARLKEAGVVSKRVDARKQEATKYMRAKVRKFFDVAAGTKIAVKAPDNIRALYSEKGIFEERGKFLIVPKEQARQKSKIVKGQIVTFKPMGNGGITEIVLPWNAADMLDLANKLERDPSIAPELDNVDQYAFTLFGHSSSIGFPTKAELVEHIKLRYQHLFKGESGRQGVAHFKLIKYSSGAGTPPNDPNAEKIYSPKGQGRRPNATGRDWYANKMAEVQRAKKRKMRAKMTGKELEDYRAKARARAALSYANKKARRDDNGF